MTEAMGIGGLLPLVVTVGCGSIRCRTAAKVKAGVKPPKCNSPANAHRRVLPAGVYCSFSLFISFFICSITSILAISPARLYTIKTLPPKSFLKLAKLAFILSETE